MDLNEQIILEADNWAHVPYCHRGTTRQGCDCTGLIIGIMQSLGFMKNYQLRKYPVDWNLHDGIDNHIQEEMEKVAVSIHRTNKQPGDILLFRFKNQKHVAHVGILLTTKLFIHAWRSAGQCKVSTLDGGKQWLSRMTAVYRFDIEKIRRLS